MEEGGKKYEYAIVGFKVFESKSVYYRRCRDIEEVKKAVEVAFKRRGAHFVSIRRLKDSEG